MIDEKVARALSIVGDARLGLLSWHSESTAKPRGNLLALPDLFMSEGANRRLGLQDALKGAQEQHHSMQAQPFPSALQGSVGHPSG